MKMRLAALALTTLAFASASLSNASVTYGIKTSGFGNSTSAGINGMIWGLVVNSAGATFGGSAVTDLAVALEGFSIPAIAPTSTPVQIGTSDYYFVRSQTDSSSSGPPSFSNGFFNNVKFDLSAPVGNGDAAGLLWFAEGTTTAGSHFGFQDISNTLPSDGADITTGFTATGALATNVIGIPEPSRAVLAGLGLMGLFFRRRR